MGAVAEHEEGEDERGGGGAEGGFDHFESEEGAAGEGARGRKSTSAAVKATALSPKEMKRFPRQKARMAKGATVRTICGSER